VKERLNLTIDGALLEAMKTYAASKQMSVSELVESYFRQVTKPVQRENILDMVDRLEAPVSLDELAADREQVTDEGQLAGRVQEANYGV
jgi:DNA-binding transcriptional regulator YbjK